ncbi:MAG: restriction endonuclease subunit S [Deltaproteobacteria bacterium]|nr:restriction endonuclease subunit S [Deltaproteobacteria bacterium]
MGSEWKQYRLSDVIDLIGGGTPKRSHPEYWGGEIPWLSVKDFNNDYRHVFEAEEAITKEGLENSSTKLLYPGQLIISARGTVGALAQLVKPMAFNQSCYGITAKNHNVINDFLYYLLKFTVANLRQITHGAVFDTITRETFNYVTVALPPLSEQRAIAHILGSLDDKIELNRQMNRTLEKMAQAIFKSWFIDFDPVRAKAEGRDPGLPKEIASLFPNSFEDSELGPIPKGWRATTIGSEFDLTMGQSPPGSTYNEEGEGLPFFQGRRDFGFRYPSNRVYCTAPTRIAHAGDTLVSVRAPVGDINMAYETCCVGRGVAAVRHKSGSRSYTYYAMLALGERFKSYEAEGTVFGAINKKQFQNLPSIAPQPDIVSSFEKLAYPLDENIRSFEEEIRTLSETRDTLLPKLISGELRVPDAEKLVEGMV